MSVEYHNDLFEKFDYVEHFSGYKINRGDLVNINGKTVRRLMIDEYEAAHEGELSGFDQWYRTNLEQKTKDYVMDAYRNNIYVEMFMVDETGKLISEEPEKIEFHDLEAQEEQKRQEERQVQQYPPEQTDSLDNDTMDFDTGSAFARVDMDERKVKETRADILRNYKKTMEEMKSIPLEERKEPFNNEAGMYQRQFPEQIAALVGELRAADRFLLTGSDQYKHMQESLNTMSNFMKELDNPPTKEQVQALQTLSEDLSTKVDTYLDYKDVNNTTKNRSSREIRRINAATAVKVWCSELQKSVKTLDKGYAYFGPEMEAQQAAMAEAEAKAKAEAEAKAKAKAEAELNAKIAEKDERLKFGLEIDDYIDRRYGTGAGKEYKEDRFRFHVKLNNSDKLREVGVMQHLTGRIKVDRSTLSDYLYEGIREQRQEQQAFQEVNLNGPTEKEKQQEIRKDKCKDMVARMVAVEMIANERRATFKRTSSFYSDKDSMEYKYAKNQNGFLDEIKKSPRVREILDHMSPETMKNFLSNNEAKSIAADFVKEAQAKREAEKKAREEAERIKAAQEKAEAERIKAAQEKAEADKRWTEAPLEERLVGREAFEEHNVSEPLVLRKGDVWASNVYVTYRDFQREYNSIDLKIKNREDYLKLCEDTQDKLFTEGLRITEKQLNPEDREVATDIMAGFVAYYLLRQQKERYGGDKQSPAEQLFEEVGAQGFLNKVKEGKKFQQAVEDLNGSTFHRMIENEEYKMIAYQTLNEAKNTRQEQFGKVEKKEQGAVMQ